MNKIKYRFEIFHQTELMRDISRFMRNVDLGDREFGVVETVVFSYSGEDKPIDYFKDLIIRAFAYAGSSVLRIEGGKVE